MRLLEKKKRKVTINITSLIDVVLLLLIFFMLTTSFVEQPGMKLDLPETKSSQGEKSGKLQISVNSDGSIFVNNEAVEMSDLESKIKTISEELEDKSLLLKADKTVHHGIVVQIMDIARSLGLQKIIIASEQKK
ncbi:MAG: biopolymer transporter ExbD [Candidatus Cloacimonetes bacterium]|nr:biopolymer transporter ExbD [Candidatus Cloacimonadota bacterium]MCF7813971.1 biopolymer transporter ExbD [Candidatus Cloacimonadota bacterium]MCF7868815.1 biopolymer transporter ExbD [Candidatus Cloacimonadota bacterium]MCF7884074.1 biopolymer transporter ExbD [Candidatus Cloacimonadota bacterium]